MEITISEIKTVSSILFVVGAALSWGEVRIQRGEDHREKYEEKMIMVEQDIKDNRIDIATLQERNRGSRLAFDGR